MSKIVMRDFVSSCKTENKLGVVEGLKCNSNHMELQIDQPAG